MKTHNIYSLYCIDLCRRGRKAFKRWKVRDHQNSQELIIESQLRKVKHVEEDSGGGVRGWSVFDLGPGTDQLLAEKSMTIEEIAKLIVPHAVKRIQQLAEKLPALPQYQAEPIALATKPCNYN